MQGSGLEEEMKKIILTGDRPTGKLHVGHYVGSLKRRVELQNSGENVLLLFVKIAELKKINDMSGRQMGDETVIRTARSIQSAERSVLEQQADDMLCSNK